MNVIQKPIQRGFTLLELLIVIAILATLAAIVIIVLNPAESLKQARDSQRLSNLSALKSAISIYITLNASSLDLDGANSNSCAGEASVKVFVSVPSDNGESDPTDLPSGVFAYSRVTQTNVAKNDGNGWMPINLSAQGASISALPIDPTNTFASGNYYSYVCSRTNSVFELNAKMESTKYASGGTQNKVTTDGGDSSNKYEIGTSLALTPLTYPDNWVLVPGSATYGTSDFYVMKYNAKCIATSSSVPLTSPDTGYKTYDNIAINCTSANSKYLASVPSGYPIGSISHTNAKTYCTSIGAHLLTNEEYMTIVRNAEQVGSNWNGGVVGTSYLFSGHNDGAPSNALEASADDTDGYFGTGNSSPSNQRRTFALSNGSVVWDFAGNVQQHVQRPGGDPVTTMALPVCSNGTAGWEWCQYDSTTIPYVSAWSADVSRVNSGPSNTSWNSTQGVGQVYTWGTGANQFTTTINRGGYWNDGSSAGAFALDVSWLAGYSNTVMGFRCVR